MRGFPAGILPPGYSPGDDFQAIPSVDRGIARPPPLSLRLSASSHARPPGVSRPSLGHPAGFAVGLPKGWARLASLRLSRPSLPRRPRQSSFLSPPSRPGIPGGAPDTPGGLTCRSAPVATRQGEGGSPVCARTAFCACKIRSDRMGRKKGNRVRKRGIKEVIFKYHLNIQST